MVVAVTSFRETCGDVCAGGVCAAMITLNAITLYLDLIGLNLANRLKMDSMLMLVLLCVTWAMITFWIAMHGFPRLCAYCRSNGH